MPTLRSPDGCEYRRTDPVEIRNLVLGYGYTVVDSAESTQDTDSSEREETDTEETAPTDG